MLLPSGNSSSTVNSFQAPVQKLHTFSNDNGGAGTIRGDESSLPSMTPAFAGRGLVSSSSSSSDNTKNESFDGQNSQLSLDSKMEFRKPSLSLGKPSEWSQHDCDFHLSLIQSKLKDGWTVHLSKEGRLYYCNHQTKTASWLPSCEDWSKEEEMPYGWERAIDAKNRCYYINHLNKTTTYEAPERVKWEDDKPPEPRVVVLQRSPTLGFGFVAGSERPVVVRFVTENGPSVNHLEPGDQILAVNGEDVRNSPRDHVIQLVRSCESQVTLLVCQPSHDIIPGRKSTLLSAGKRAKLRSRPSRVRFAESVCVNGAPFFPPSAFSLSDICVPAMANVLKVFLENGQTKSFKYDATTTVQDVVSSLLSKLCLEKSEVFSLVLEHVKSLKRNKLTLLDPEESLARIAAQPGAHKLRCLFRVTFVPISAADLAQKDLNALDYLYMQCCNDVTQERFAPELQPEVALRLAALHIYQHALANNVAPNKLTVKLVEREFGLERFVPISLFEGMKRKELRRLISHFLKSNDEMSSSAGKPFTQLQTKLQYLEIISNLPSYGAKCFNTNPREGIERVLLVSPRFGLSQLSNIRNSVPQPISAIEDFKRVVIEREDDVTCSISIIMTTDRVIKFSMEEREACEFSLVLAGYYRVLTGQNLQIDRQREHDMEEHAPLYLSQHIVFPADWSYLRILHAHLQSANFFFTPQYQEDQQLEKTKEMRRADPLSRTSSSQNSSLKIKDKYPKAQFSAMMHSKSAAEMGLDLHSVVATELLEEAKTSDSSDRPENFRGDRNEEILRRVHEMQKMVENSEQYLTEQGGGGGSLYDHSNDNSAVTNCVGFSEHESDCESLNSSKISSSEDTSQPNALKHSDSLELLAEAINEDISGLAKSLQTISSGLKPSQSLLSTTCSPSQGKKLNNIDLMLNNLHTLATDFSQSESDSESINSPPSNSPIAQRPTLRNADRSSRKQSTEYRGSFGLHSPDGGVGNCQIDAKNFHLREYLHQLKAVSNNGMDLNRDGDAAVKQLSEIYGFEIGENPIIETDTDLIDLRTLPPPQTPDELDAFTVLLNAPPAGFDDYGTSNKNGERNAVDPFDKFIQKVVVAPPTQKTTPSKELTPEEIMSYIIPPPPNLEAPTVQEGKGTPSSPNTDSKQSQPVESLYSNTQATKASAKKAEPEARVNSPNGSHIIAYGTVERKNKFSCCPKSKEIDEEEDAAGGYEKNSVELPPRINAAEIVPPVRPPKNPTVLQSSVKPPTIAGQSPRPTASVASSAPGPRDSQCPPVLPPRLNQQKDKKIDEYTSPVVSAPPTKPPLPSFIHSSTPETCFVKKTNNHTTQFQPTKPTQPTAFKTPDSHNTQQCNYSPNSRILCHFENSSYASSNAPSILTQQKTENRYAFVNKPKKQVDKLIIRNGHIIDGEALLAKTEVAMTGLLIKLDQVAQLCSKNQAAGGGERIDEDKFQKARSELTEQTLVLVTASKFLVVSMSDPSLSDLPENLTSCLTAIRRITELTQDMARHTSAPLQTRNIILKVHDVSSSFRELVAVQIGPMGAGQLALQAECLANVLATLLRSLRVFSP